jgi:tetratricopeptide (TPR) repeat protein
VLREVLVIRHKRGDDEKPDRLYTLRALGETLEREGKWTEAESIWRESLVLWRKRGSNEERQSMYTLRKLALALEAERKWPEAESVHREALSISRKKGNEDPEALADREKLVRVLTNQKKFAQAEELLNSVAIPSLVMQPSSVNLLAQRVNLMGRRGQWQEAAAAAALALENQPTDHYRYHTLAGLLAMTGNRTAYEQLCKRLLAKFPNPENPFVAERMAQDSLLLPNSGVDLEVVDKLADTAITVGNGDASMPYFQACKAMSSYRREQFPEAIAWGEKAAKSSIDFAQAKAFAVLAMAHWQLGQKEIARLMLAKGDSFAPGIVHGSEVDIGESWVAWLFARISLDEAAALIQPESTPANESNSKQ